MNHVGDPFVIRYILGTRDDDPCGRKDPLHLRLLLDTMHHRQGRVNLCGFKISIKCLRSAAAAVCLRLLGANGDAVSSVERKVHFNHGGGQPEYGWPREVTG